jgi:hypothetical protein
MVLRNAITASSYPHLGKLRATSPLLVVRGLSPVQGVPQEREYIFHPNMLQLSVGGRRKPPSRQLSRLQTRRRRLRKRIRRGHPGLQRGGRSLPTSPLQACPSRQRSQARQRSSSSLKHIRWHWQVPPQWSLRPYPKKNTRQQASQFGPLM